MAFPDPTDTTKNLAKSDYAGNGGDAYVSFNNNGTMNGPADYASGTTGTPGKSGWNAAATGSNGIFYGASQTRTAEISDGTSNTYLCAEKFLDPSNYGTGAGPGDNENFCTGYEDDIARWTGPDPRVSASAALVVAYAPRQDKDGESPVSVGGVNTFPFFGSAHSGGFNAAMCDGSVKSISYTIDSNTHYCLGNRRTHSRSTGASSKMPLPGSERLGYDPLSLRDLSHVALRDYRRRPLARQGSL